MKKFKTLAMVLAAITVGSVTVSAMAASHNINAKNKAKTTTIGAQKAKEIALQQSGLKEADVTFEKAALEYDNNVAVYDVEFHTDNTEYEYEINAVSGVVVESTKENRKPQSSINQNTNSGTVTNENATNQNANNGNTNGESTSGGAINNQVSNSGSSNNQTTNTQNQIITSAKAKEIALAHAGLVAGDVTFEKAKLDNDDHGRVYEVEFYTASAEYDYEINAVSGTIIESNKESRKTQSSAGQNTNNRPSNNQTTNSQNQIITSAKAKEIALAHAGLAGQSVVFENAKLDREDGVSVYEVEFRYNGKEYSYEINAVSGAVIEFEVDND